MGREIVAILTGWLFTFGFFGLVLYAVYRINGVYRQVEELREDLRAVRDRLDGLPPLQ